MQLVSKSYWTVLIKILVEKYFFDLNTVCILWPQNFDFNLQISVPKEIVWLQINPFKLNNSFENNIYDFQKREETDKQNKVFYSHLTKKLIAAIEQSHCEGFIAFQDDIPQFAEAFQKASIYSLWRSMNNRFLFAFSRDQKKTHYFHYDLFRNQAHIIVVEADVRNSSIFQIKTNKFVGLSTEQPEKLINLSTFFAANTTFVPALQSFAFEKLKNLQGRELIVGAFDYRPFVAVDFQRLPLYYDRASDNPSHLVHVDGTEIRLCHVFCELYNCTVQFDTSIKDDWGFAFSNYSGKGMVGSVIEDKVEMAFGAMYEVHSFYRVIDMTAYLGRSGVTCLVPTAASLVSWDLPLRPFEFSLWSAVMACLCLETIVLFVARIFEQKFTLCASNWRSSLQFAYTTSLKLFINQSSSCLVQSHTVRTFLFACYMFDIILTSLYGGGLSAILTLPNFGEAADSVERLVKYNLTWTGSTYDLLESISEVETEEENIYRHLLNNFKLNTMEEMRSKAQWANMGFVLERLAFGHFGGGDFLTPRASQRLKLMIDDVYSQFTVAVVSRIWPHLGKFNNLLLQWHASGLDKFWEWKSTADYLNVQEQNQLEASKYIAVDLGPTKLNLQNFAGLIILWLVGVLVSLLSFVLEIIWFKWSQQQTKNKIPSLAVKAKHFAQKSVTLEEEIE